VFLQAFSSLFSDSSTFHNGLVGQFTDNQSYGGIVALTTQQLVNGSDIESQFVSKLRIHKQSLEKINRKISMNAKFYYFCSMTKKKTLIKVM